MSARGSPERRGGGADAPAEPPAVVGRRIGAHMGSVHFGGSGRPVPSVFNATKGSNGASVSRAPRVALEANPSSPFARKLKAEKAISLSPRNFGDSRQAGGAIVDSISKAETRRSTESAGSQSQSRPKRQSPSGCASRVAVARARESERSRRRVQRAPAASEPAKPTDPQKRDHGSKVSDAAVQRSLDVSSPVVLTSPLVAAEDCTPGQSDPTTHSTTSASFPTRTVGRQPFHLMEGAHRRAEPTGKRYHVAFHPPIASPTVQSDDVAANTFEPKSPTYFMDTQLPLSLRSTPTDIPDTEDGGPDVWRTVDDSMNQLYEDPPIELVKSTLFHASLSTNGQSRKRLKQKQHQRILVAADELREAKAQQQAEQDQAWRRKEQMQALSATIRRRNKKFARSVDGAQALRDADAHSRRGHQAQYTVSFEARKPPVPRLSGSRGQLSKRKRSKRGQVSGRSDVESSEDHPRTSTVTSAGVGGHGAAASILLGDLQASDAHESQTTSVQEGVTGLPTTAPTTTRGTDDQPEHRRERKRRPTPGQSAAQRKQALERGADLDNGKPSEALDHRRAIAREYMLLQQQQRMIRKAEAQQRDQMEREKRRQQLETLEARRLENLKHSRKRRLPHQQAPLRRRNKPRAKPQTRSERQIVPTSSDVAGLDETKPVGRAITDGTFTINHEPQSDAENDGAYGNTEAVYRQQASSASKPSNTSVAPSRDLLFGNGEIGPSTLETEDEQQQPAAANTHIQRLLDLHRKAQELSQRLSGVRSAQETSKSHAVTAQTHSPKPETPSDGGGDCISLRVDRSTRVHGREHDTRSQDDGASHPSPTDCGGEDYEGEVESDGSDEVDSGEEEGSDLASSSDGVDGDVGSANGDAMDEVEERESMDDERSMTVFQHRDSNTDASRYEVSLAMADMSDGLDVDIRSIGVYNIAVVWPLAQEQPSAESTGRFSEVSSSAASSSSSRSDRSTGDHDENQGGAEVSRFAHAFYCDEDSDNDSSAESVRSPRDHKRSGRTSEEWPASKMAELMHSIDSLTKFSLDTAEHHRNDRVGFATTAWRLDMRSAPSDAFHRLVQAEDDSLSVIQRAAVKLYERQQERERIRQENEQQQRVEHASIDSADVSQESGSDDNSPARQFARLDEIMEEVDRERSLSHAALDNEAPDDCKSIGNGDIDRNDLVSDRVEKAPHARSEVTASTEFWNRLISESLVDQDACDDGKEEQEATQHHVEGRACLHVEIDTSELEEQREQRLQRDERDAEMEEEEGRFAFGDPDDTSSRCRRRVDSPRTLARRLLAEVEYHEAINEAHLKLTAMEQAQLLEQVQAETITIATAFKEEMEQNAVSHQLALDHTTLAKRFDEDLQDVVHQLHDVEGIEEQERMAREIVLEIQLKRARMRECSVQTEDTRVSEVGTSALLQVDAGTSPIVPSMSTAVQYDLSYFVPQEASSASQLETLDKEEDGQPDEDSVRMADSAAVDYGDEGFEQESGIQSRTLKDQDGSCGDYEEEIRSEADSSHTVHAQEVSEEESVIESATSIVESGSVESKEASARIEEEDDLVSDAAESHHSCSEGEGDVQSASAEYEDDFSASSPTAKTDRGFAASEIDDSCAVESDYGDENNDDKATSVDDKAIDDDDEAISDVEEDHQAATESAQDASIDDEFEKEFAQSADDAKEREDDDKLPDYVQDDTDRSEAQPTKDPTTATRKIATDKTLHPQITTTSDLNTLHPASSAISANSLLHDALPYGFGYPQQFTASPLPLISQTADEAAPSDHVTRAYMTELERRKQSELSMLSLRLQAAEANFAHQMRRIDAAIANITVDAAGRSELMARKQRLSIAFMGEQANIESLKAAATARYFQDMLAFQSLYATEATNVAVTNGLGIDANRAWVGAPEIPVAMVAPCSESARVSRSSVGAESECYEDEFASATGDEAKSSHSSIAERGETSVVDEEDDAYESDKQPSEGSIASEVDHVSQEDPSHKTGESMSDMAIESENEHDTDEKCVESEAERAKDVEEVQSNEYAQSEFEDETQDTPDDQVVVEEHAARGEISEDEEEIPNTAADNDKKIIEDNVDTSEIQEEGGGESSSGSVEIEDVDGYENDFASVSGDTRRRDASSSTDEAPADEPGEEDIDEEGESPPPVDEHEIASDYSEGEGDTASGAFAHDVSASAAAYSEDGFGESKHAEDTPPIARTAALDTADSAVHHSASDDSSTTKLLVAQVDATQKLVAGEVGLAGQSDKLKRKKTKVIELLEAKERLLQQETSAFRLEEEKRMVDEAAHLALGLDISQELRHAKASIVCELQSEFDALQLSFPTLKKVVKPSIVASVAGSTPSAPPTTPTALQSVALNTVAERNEGADDDDYDAQSFEDVSADEENESVDEKERDNELPDDVPNAECASDTVQASIASEKYSEFSEDDSAAEEEIPESDDDAVEASVQSEVEEENVEKQLEVDEVDAAVVQSDGHVDSDSEGYENDYESESFADAQSVADEVDPPADSVRPERTVDPTEASNGSASQSDAASEYAEDDFDQASESESALGAHGHQDVQEVSEYAAQDGSVAVSVPQDTEVVNADEAGLSVSDNELSAALADVASKLEDLQPRQVDEDQASDGDSIDPPTKNHALDHAEQSTRELMTSCMTPALESQRDGQSMSTSLEEETLTKSIEERMARLETLKARILERQNDIRLVHKQLRVEKRKEALTAEEKALWAEVDGLEHKLQGDVASLELVRQRNRLEFSQLEARQQLTPTSLLGFERDLLIGFDYVEVVEPCAAVTSLQRDVDVQTPSGVEVECQTVATPAFEEKELTSTYLSDLLAGYDFIEHALDVLPHAVVATDRLEETAHEAQARASAVNDPSAQHCVTEVAAEVLQVPEEGDEAVDLLNDFDYIEAVEPLSDSKVDLLAAFDYCESVDPLAQAIGLASQSPLVAEKCLDEESADSGSELPAEEAASLAEVPASDDPTAPCGKPAPEEGESDDEVSEDTSFIEELSEMEVPAREFDGGGGNYDQDHSLDTDSASAGDGRVGEYSEEVPKTSVQDATAGTDVNTVDTITSLILSDLLEDAGSALGMFELNARRYARSQSHVITDDSQAIARPKPCFEVVSAATCDDQLLSEAVEHTNTTPTANEAPGSHVQVTCDVDLASQVDAATESIFASLLDDVLWTQLRARTPQHAPHRQSSSRLLPTPCESGPKASSPSSPSPCRVLTQPQQALGVLNVAGVATETETSPRQLFVDQTLATLQVEDDCVRLGNFSALDAVELQPGAARLLYDAIEEIGQSALDAHRVADHTFCPTASLSGQELLSALRQAIRRELESLRCVQTELHESADRRLKALADADDQMDDDDIKTLRMFSARPTSESSVVTTAAPTWIARPPSTLAPWTLDANGSALVPRTPTPRSRGKSRAHRSLLTLARNRHAAELQHRVTSAMLNELLEDAMGAATSTLR